MRLPLEALLVVVCWAGLSVGQTPTESNLPPPPTPAERQQMIRSHEVSVKLNEAILAWGADPSENKQQACEKLIQEYVEANKGGIAFIEEAAAAAELVGLNGTARRLLEESLSQGLKGQGWAQLSIPTAVGANIFLGRLLRDSGEYEGALTAYKRAAEACNDDSQKGLKALSLLYVAEIQATLLKDPEGARASLKEAQAAAERIPSEWAPEFYQALVKRAHEEIQGESPTTVCPYTDALEPVMFIVPLLNGSVTVLNGPDAMPGTPLRNLALDGLKGATKSTKSGLDRQFGQLALQKFYSDGSNMQEAEDLLQGLFDSPAFMAPVAGMYLAQLQLNQGKQEEAGNTATELLSRGSNAGWSTVADRLMDQAKKLDFVPKPGN